MTEMYLTLRRKKTIKLNRLNTVARFRCLKRPKCRSKAGSSWNYQNRLGRFMLRNMILVWRFPMFPGTARYFDMFQEVQSDQPQISSKTRPMVQSLFVFLVGQIKSTNVRRWRQDEFFLHSDCTIPAFSCILVIIFSTFFLSVCCFSFINDYGSNLDSPNWKLD